MREYVHDILIMKLTNDLPNPIGPGRPGKPGIPGTPRYKRKCFDHVN